jgi:flagellar biosynthetic protein FliS
MDGSTDFAGKVKAYRGVAGLDAKPEELMKMALDTVRVSLLRAEAAIAAGDRVEKAHALASAGSVVEFMLGLSGADRGILSDRLATSYQYVMAAILKGNVEDDAEAVASGRAVIEHLSTTWRRVFSDEHGLSAADTPAPRPRHL